MPSCGGFFRRDAQLLSARLLSSGNFGQGRRTPSREDPADQRRALGLEMHNRIGMRCAWGSSTSRACARRPACGLSASAARSRSLLDRRFHCAGRAEQARTRRDRIRRSVRRLRPDAPRGPVAGGRSRARSRQVCWPAPSPRARIRRLDPRPPPLPKIADRRNLADYASTGLTAGPH